MSESRTQSADSPTGGEARNFSAPLFPIRPASGRARECSNLGLANALDCRSDPPCISRNRRAITGRTKPDQSMKSSTSTPKTSTATTQRFAFRFAFFAFAFFAFFAMLPS
jgi:hypothetical protein